MTEPKNWSSFSRFIWDTKYRFAGRDVAADATIGDTWRRVARAVAQAEPSDVRASWTQRFETLLQDFRFLPGGRILAGAGTQRHVTLFNCFVMGRIDDSLDGIFDALKEGALTMQQGGGVGYDFSTLRPRGSRNKATGTLASGPVSFMQIWDSMCATLLSTGARRGAMMATLRCDHPDVEEFIDAKRDAQRLRRFNVSVLVSDAFMTAVRQDADWPLVFPDDAAEAPSATVERVWSGATTPVRCRVVRVVRARELWQRILRAAYDCAEPGVLFVDRINANNNLYYREHLSATNPCGELPLPAYGACNLGSLNLVKFVVDPFTTTARIDADALAAASADAVRFLDDVIDVSQFPLPQQRAQVHGSRRIGLGVTALADALIMLGLRYDSAAGRAHARATMATICHSAYRASIALAQERGAFPWYDARAYAAGEFIAALPDDIRAALAQHGIRNSHLLAIAPTGTISLLADNVSSGLEPVFAPSYQRRIWRDDGATQDMAVEDYALRAWRERGATGLPPAWVTTESLAPDAHLLMQAALQAHVDSAISKTINVPAATPFEQFQSVYERAYDLRLKGCTVFRPNAVTGRVLSAPPADAASCQWCGTDKEPD